MVATRAAQGIGSGRRYTHMTSNLVRYRDATDDPDQRVDYPSVVAEFTALGFVQVGRIVAEPIDGTYEDLAESFPPEQRELFELHHLESMPIAEIAQALSKSEDAVKSNLYRTRKLLLSR